jgi:hypothetical protein
LRAWKGSVRGTPQQFTPLNTMNRIANSLSVLAIASMLSAMPVLCLGQQQRANRGNFDPQQARQRMMDRYREQFEIKDDATWSAIEPRIQKVMEARRDASTGMGFAMMRRPRGGGGGADNAGSDQGQGQQARRNRNANTDSEQGNTNRRGPQLSPAAQELRQAVDTNASSDVIKAKLAAYREDHKQKQAKLQDAQEELRKVLSLKQEANAVLLGLLQ